LQPRDQPNSPLLTIIFHTSPTRAEVTFYPYKRILDHSLQHAATTAPAAVLYVEAAKHPATDLHYTRTQDVITSDQQLIDPCQINHATSKGFLGTACPATTERECAPFDEPCSSRSLQDSCKVQQLACSSTVNLTTQVAWMSTNHPLQTFMSSRGACLMLNVPQVDHCLSSQHLLNARARWILPRIRCTEPMLCSTGMLPHACCPGCREALARLGCDAS
jgi:hypothetical protein